MKTIAHLAAAGLIMFPTVALSAPAGPLDPFPGGKWTSISPAAREVNTLRFDDTRETVGVYAQADGIDLYVSPAPEKSPAPRLSPAPSPSPSPSPSPGVVVVESLIPGADKSPTPELSGTPLSRVPAEELDRALARAEELLWKGSFTSARVEYERILAADPDSLDAMVGLGLCHNFLGDIDRALDLYLKAHRIKPDLPNLKTWIAEQYVVRGRSREAFDWLKKELAVNPQSAWGHSWMGSVFLQAGETDKAEKAFLSAVRIDPGITDHRYQNGLALAGRGQYGRAIHDFLAVIYMDRNAAPAHFWLGACYTSIGDSDSALRAYEQYLQYDSSSELADTARAEINRLRPEKQ